MSDSPKKKLTLDETWKYCLAMYKWIARQCELLLSAPTVISIGRLKCKWLEEHGFSNIEFDCFFCDYRVEKHRMDCRACPGKKVDRNFSCIDSLYSYYGQPTLFYKKLLELNKIRLAKKRVKK